jgi:Kdo2-lipid IVA lauroyltransferase/acyltransferase
VAEHRDRPGDAFASLAARGFLGLLAPLPWPARLRAAGWLGRTTVARSRRLSARVATNLGHVLPETTEADRTRIAREVGDCFGRTALELFAARAFESAHPWNPPRGPGLPAVEAALAERRGAIVVSGHFGGWEATRAWLKEQGAPCATVYRPLKNKHLDALYHDSVAHTGSPMLPKGRLAVRTLVRHLNQGGFVALLVDQYDHGSPALDFLGRPAPTTLTPAELALKFRMPLIPAYAPRTPDGARIDIWFDAPIPPTSAPEMMQAFNHSLAAQVRARPGQYYWLHRRWEKCLPGLAEKRAAARPR